ncbi:MAG: GTP-binding protein, partial [Candidatus Eremiobacterota bacterium]
MKKYTTEQIRNIGLYGHQASGKTSLGDAMLFLTGAADRQGKVDDGNSQLDFDPDEVQRRMTIYTAMA